MAAIDGLAQDLNLLAALEVLLAEQNVTRAARRLRLTQSTMSHTLGRLRVALGDPLLVRAGRGMVLTPRAEGLASPLARALAELRRVVSDDGAFEPATSTRRFALGCPDLVVSFLPDLVATLARTAPHVRLDVVPSLGVDLPAALGAASLDAALAPAPTEGAGLAQRVLGSVRFCVLARRKHPALARGRRWDLDAWLAHPHVVVHTGTAGPGLVGAALERMGRQRTVGMTAPSFLLAPFVVAESDLFFAAPRELVVGVAHALDLAVLELPLAVPRAPVALLWHERMSADPGHLWFRELLAAVGKRVLGGKTRSGDRDAPPRRGTP